MFIGRYGYGKQYETNVCEEELTLHNEAKQSRDGFKAVVNRLMRAENYSLAEEIYELFKGKWGCKI